MLVAVLVCSDHACAAEFTAWASSLAELETLACACDCGLAVLRVSAGDAGDAELELTLPA